MKGKSFGQIRNIVNGSVEPELMLCAGGISKPWLDYRGVFSY